MNDQDFPGSHSPRTASLLLATLLLGLWWSPVVFGENAAEAEAEELQKENLSADDVAKKLANPAGSLANLANNLTYKTHTGDIPGAGDQTSTSYLFQPVLPFPVGDKGRNIIVRPAITVSFDHPVYDSNTGQWDNLSTELNDITFDTVYAGTPLSRAKRPVTFGALAWQAPCRLPLTTHWAANSSAWVLSCSVALFVNGA